MQPAVPEQKLYVIALNSIQQFSLLSFRGVENKVRDGMTFVVSRSHTDQTHSVALVRTSDQLVAEGAMVYHTTREGNFHALIGI